jgi:hypothetical protein
MTIFFDQGVGAWKAGDVSFNFAASVSIQISELEIEREISVNSNEGTYVAISLSS